MKAIFVTVDTGTMETHTFEADINSLCADAVTRAYEKNLAECLGELEVQPHKMVHFEIVGSEAAFIMITIDPVFGHIAVCGSVAL
jgi:hypothetical protein